MKEILMKLISSFNIRSFLTFSHIIWAKEEPNKAFQLRNQKKKENPIALKPILKLHLAWLSG